MQVHPQQRPIFVPAKHFVVGSSSSFAQMCVSNEAGGGNLDLFLSGDISRTENWDLMVICKGEGTSPDWKWCEDKVKWVFSSANFRITRRNEALVSLSSIEEVDKLVNLPPLDSWNGSFHFKKWTSVDGSFTEISDGGKNIQVRLHGLPYHLRTSSAMRRMAQMWGFSNVSDVQEGLNGREQCGFTIVNGDFANIPRMIFVREANRRFPVLIEVVIASVIGEDGISQSTEFSSGSPKRNIPSDCGACKQRQVHVTTVGSNSNLSQPPGFERQRTHLSPLNQASRDLGPRIVDNNRFAPMGDETTHTYLDTGLLEKPIIFQFRSLIQFWVMWA
ncbi:hypothetical protein FRX31_026133 [Thalictrum thalictroides]|uniref:Uncharacterized protein n=1 Tax=Thalictrum thalictroides TaxID=46969 RepID=A0A7J6VI69_THATH|nr:hypothetical protein FRX31_026133 [Thalictrum thalictroides]